MYNTDRIVLSKDMLKDFAEKNHIMGELLALSACRPWLPEVLFQTKFDSLTKELIELDEKYTRKSEVIRLGVRTLVVVSE